MKPKDRQTDILNLIGRQGEVTVEALSEEFGVSAETIRRDLMQLAESGDIQKIHGGAKRSRLRIEGSFAERVLENAEGKRVIAQKIAHLIAPGETLFMDTGTTTLACAQALADKKGITVITNSFEVARAFGKGSGNSTVYLVGGRYHPENAQTLGPLAIEQLRRFHADRAILTVAALDARSGAMDASFEEAQIARAMLDLAPETIITAHGDKIGKRAAYHVCDPGEIDILVSDDDFDENTKKSLSCAGIEVR